MFDDNLNQKGNNGIRINHLHLRTFCPHGEQPFEVDPSARACFVVLREAQKFTTA